MINPGFYFGILVMIIFSQVLMFLVQGLYNSISRKRLGKAINDWMFRNVDKRIIKVLLFIFIVTQFLAFLFSGEFTVFVLIEIVSWLMITYVTSFFSYIVSFGTNNKDIDI